MARLALYIRIFDFLVSGIRPGIKKGVLICLVV